MVVTRSGRDTKVTALPNDRLLTDTWSLVIREKDLSTNPIIERIEIPDSEPIEWIEREYVFHPVIGLGHVDETTELPADKHHLLTKIELDWEACSWISTETLNGIDASLLLQSLQPLPDVEHVTIVLKGPQTFGFESLHDDFIDFFSGHCDRLSSHVPQELELRIVWKKVIIKSWLPALKRVDLVRLNTVGDVLKDNAFISAVRTAKGPSLGGHDIANVEVPIVDTWATDWWKAPQVIENVRLGAMDDFLARRDKYALEKIRAWIKNRDEQRTCSSDSEDD